MYDGMERRDAYRVVVGKPDGKTQLGRQRHRWEDNIRMDLQEMGCRGIDWIKQGQVAGTCERGNKPSGSIKFREFLD